MLSSLYTCSQTHKIASQLCQSVPSRRIISQFQIDCNISVSLMIVVILDSAFDKSLALP